MRSNRHAAGPIGFDTVASTELITARFPGAVQGEDYRRFVRAVWRDGERWFARHSHRIGRESIGLHLAHAILWDVAARELQRDLTVSEDRLLGDLLYQRWSTVERLPDGAEPEIPEFLLPPLTST